MKKKILIIGNTAKEYALANKISDYCEVFVIPGNDAIKEFATCIDIREDSVQEILEYVMENNIDLTIPVSMKALCTDIVNVFNANNLEIFAPDKNAIRLMADKAYAKKLMYKLRIPTPKFGIFEKQSMANDYIKNYNQPFVIKTNAPSSAVILTTPKSAKPILDSVFAEKFNKIIIEDYVYGTPFAFYAITDGYKALPIGSSILYKHSLEGEGGQLTSGMGACAPNFKISSQDEDFLLNEVIYPILEHIENNGTAYSGILGVNGVITEDSNFKILGFTPFMQDSDCSAILDLLEDNIYDLFKSCVIGSFSDEISYIQQKDMHSASVVLICKNSDNSENVIDIKDYINDNVNIIYSNNVIKNKYLEYEAKNGPVLTVTALGSTISSAVKRAYDEINNINFKGMSYRRDIGKPTISIF